MSHEANGGNKAAEGREAYQSGVSREMNPYSPGSSKYWQWSAGWLDEQAFRPRKSSASLEQNGLQSA